MRVVSVIIALFSLGSALARPAIARAQATPAPYAADGAFSLYSVHTSGVNAAGALDTRSGADEISRTDLSNGLLTFAKNAGFFRFGITAGIYAFPTVGQALNPTTQAGGNTALYGYVPQAYIALVPNEHLTIAAGQLATLLGQENGFTYQNVTIQRGLVWASEPAFSRGLRVTYTQGKFTGDLEYNDGYYTARYRALEGLVGWAPSADTSVQFAFIVPQADTPGNATTAIANKIEYDVMLTQQLGKLELLPYVLLIASPASATLGYARAQSATGAALLADYAFNGRFSIGARYEWFADRSSSTDASANADFLGYGPGSRATSFTITPEYRANPFFARAEFSSVNASGAKPGLAFGPAGTGVSQTRVIVETGVQF
ncbi:MAG TPA: outer membrane beta-barrel protein [Candidatus Dormibacteraeota bacterium]|nr:outer membrane beta-barrel protein [Candidatus Dormibacteraeota bacterium]